MGEPADSGIPTAEAGPEAGAEAGVAGPTPLTVMTFNVLCSFCGDPAEYDTWDERLVYFEDLFSRYDADLIGLQELTPIGDDVPRILERAPGMAAVFYAPDTGLPYPDSTILYRESRFEVVERGEYWLSPTPEEPLSTGFAAGTQLPRLLVWTVLEDRMAGREIFFATTHFDNNTPSQPMSAPIVMERTAPFVATHPIILTGDFNSDLADDAYSTLTGDMGGWGYGFVNTQALAAEWRVETDESPVPSYDLDRRIDHIFVAGDGVAFDVSEWIVDLTRYGPRLTYPSDHFAMVATLQYE